MVSLLFHPKHLIPEVKGRKSKKKGGVRNKEEQCLSSSLIVQYRDPEEKGKKEKRKLGPYLLWGIFFDAGMGRRDREEGGNPFSLGRDRYIIG